MQHVDWETNLATYIYICIAKSLIYICMTTYIYMSVPVELRNIYKISIFVRYQDYKRLVANYGIPAVDVDLHNSYFMHMTMVFRRIY